MDRVIVDVREAHEFAAGHAPGALNITPMELMRGTDKLDAIPKDAEVVLYCVTGVRARNATMLLNQMGYNNVVNGINKDHVEAKYC